MQRLVAGIHHFRAHAFGQQRELFERLAGGQSPDALFITCSDSRISPNLLTQTAPGELFILRNAGNIVPPFTGAPGGEAATVEFAVKGLGVRDIIVCGHTHCGAVRALLDPATITGMSALQAWLRHAQKTRQVIQKQYGDWPPDRQLVAAIEHNVLAQLEHLESHPAVAAALIDGTLALHGWVYKIETGEVFSFDRERGQFLPLDESAASTTDMGTDWPGGSII